VWIALSASLAGCAPLPWRSYAAAPPTPTRMAENATSDTVLVPASPPALDDGHEYSLVELIDIAERTSPETRGAWEQARAASARLGRAEAVYLPVLALAAEGGARRDAYPSGDGQFTAEGPYVQPRLQLAWTLLDLPRFAAVDEARAQVDQASFAFSRRHQEVMYTVARAFYALDAARARLEAAQATLRTATTVEEAVQARLEAGLATRPELLLAREQRARAAFDVEAAIGTVRSSQGTLAEAVGVPPMPPLRTTPLEAQRLPERLSVPIKQILEATLKHRPDLKALGASVRAREADLRAARGSYAPRLSLTGSVDYQGWRFDAVPPDRTFSNSTHEYLGQLRIDWDLFTGFARLNDVRAASAERAASEAALTAGTLRALREAWTAYFDVETARRQVEFATALLASAEEAYAATLESYRRGLSTVIDLLTAERDLASARSTAIDSRAQLLTAAAALTFAVGGAR
jgi:outer membrane protein